MSTATIPIIMIEHKNKIKKYTITENKPQKKCQIWKLSESRLNYERLRPGLSKKCSWSHLNLLQVPKPVGNF